VNCGDGFFYCMCDREDENLEWDFHMRPPCYCFKEPRESEEGRHRCHVFTPLRL
jgi:hypothetical protein